MGGLIGINRQFNEEALKQAFKTHALDATVSQQYPIKDAVKTLQALQIDFAAAAGLSRGWPDGQTLLGWLDSTG